MNSVDVLAQKSSLIQNVIGFSFVSVLFLICLAGMVSISQFFSVLILRIADIRFPKKIISRIIAVQTIAAVTGLIAVFIANDVSKNNYILIAASFFVVFVATALGLIILLKKWIYFGAPQTLALLFILNDIGVIAIAAYVFMEAGSYAFFFVIPIGLVGLLYFLGHYLLFEN